MCKSVFVFMVSVSFAAISCCGQDLSGGPAAKTEFEKSIRPLLMKYCNDCHAIGNMEELEFLAAEGEADLDGLRGVYAAVVEQMESRAMPPGDYDQPSDTERKLVTDWIRKTLDLKPADTDRIAQYVVDIFEDSNGYLWLGTIAKGAARFDGKTLTWFTTKNGLPSNTVTSFAEDKLGRLWMGTHEGIGRLDGETITMPGPDEGLPVPDPSTPSGLPIRGGNVMTDRDGNLWANMNYGVFRHDGSTFSEFKIPIVKKSPASYAIFDGKPSLRLQDRNGNLWFGTDGYGVFKFDGTAFTQYTQADGLCSDNINSIVEDRQGNLWIACMQSYQPKMTGDGGVCRFDGKTFTRFPDVAGLSENDIYTIYENRAGEIWIGATGVGAYRYDGNTFTLFSETDRPHWTRNFGLQAMLEDRNGTLWCGFSGGLFCFNGESFANVTEDGLQDRVDSSEQEVEPILDAPEGWRAEQIQFPLSFAPSIEFSGYEDIRFSPGWSRPDSPDFWTYKMVWQIEENPQLTEERLSSLTETYFDGLARAVSGLGDSLQKPVAVFIRDGEGYRGRLRIYDAFSTKDWIYLNTRVRGTKRGDKHLVIIEMSPQYFDHEIWKEFEKVRVKKNR